MVRLKNRYLLIDILYPDPATWPSTTPKSTSTSTSAQLAIHSPTSDALTPGLLAKMIREEVSELYGDCGVGKLGGASAGGINGRFNLYSLPLLGFYGSSFSHALDLRRGKKKQGGREQLRLWILYALHVLISSQSNTSPPQHQLPSSAAPAHPSDSSGPLLHICRMSPPQTAMHPRSGQTEVGNGDVYSGF